MTKILLLVTFLFTQVSFSQSGTTTNAHSFRFSDTLETVGIQGALGVDSERAQNRWLVRLSYDNVDNPLEDRDLRPSPLSNYIKNIRTLLIGGSYLISPRWLVGATLPIHSVLLDEQGTIVTGSGLDRKTVLGDTEVYAKWRFTNDKSRWNVALAPRLFLQTGDEKYLVSDDSFGFGLRLLLDRDFGFLKLYSHLGYANASESVLANIDRRQLLELALGLNIPLIKNLALNIELNSDVNTRNLDFRSDETRLNSLVALNYKYKKAHFYAGADVQSINRNRSDGVSYFAGVKLPFGAVAPVPVPVVEPVVEEIAEVLEKLNLERTVLYENDKAVILEESFAKLDSAAEILMKYDDQYESLSIEGHTNSIGSRRYNKGLSMRRAQSVLKYLVDKGVPADKLIAVGYGEERLKISPEVTKEDFAVNRRVEFILKETITIKK